MSWELTPTGQAHRTLNQAAAVAGWLNSQHEGRGRFVYRGVTLPDGTHRVERAPNPNVDAELPAPRR